MPEPLIETVTKPLAGNAGERTAANRMLEESFIEEHPAAMETMARFEAVGKRKHVAVWHAVLWFMASVALSFAVTPYIKSYLEDEHSKQNPTKRPHPPLPEGVSEEGRLLLGDPTVDEREQKRRLHVSDPENPAYFAEYAAAWAVENKGLPPDFLETVARIAPDNAFFLYFAAAETGRKSFEKKQRDVAAQRRRLIDGAPPPPRSREVEYDIKDRAAFNEALELISKAAALPVFKTYMNEMITTRMRHLIKLNTLDAEEATSYAFGHHSGIISLRKVAEMMSASAIELSKNGRKEEYIKFAARRDALLSAMSSNPDINLIGEMMHRVVAEKTARQFSIAAERLGLVELAGKYRRQADALEEVKDRLKSRSKNEVDPAYYRHAPSFNNLMEIARKMVVSPPLIQASELEPPRMFEHEVMGGFGVMSVVVLMLLAALALLLFRFLMPRRIRIPAKFMARVPDMADGCWVLLLGVVLPILLFLIITRFTPLGGRDYGIMYFQFAFPGVHLIALWLGLLIVPAMVMRWRQSRRLAPFGFTNHNAARSMTVIVLLLLPALAAYPVLVRFGASKWTLGALAAPLALVLCMVLVEILRWLFGKPAVRIFKTTTAIAVLPAYAIAIVALCLLMPIYHSAEKHWIAKDTLTRINPDAADLGHYEFKVAAQMRREINAMMGYE
jgi:hypothetical protein